MVLEGGGNADPLAIGVPARRRLRLGGEDGAAAEQRPGGVIDLGTDVGGPVGDLAPVPVAIAVFVVADLRIGHRDERAEVTLALREQADDAWRHPIGVAVNLSLGREDDARPVIVERAGGEELHGAGDAAFVLVGREALLY